MRLSNILSETKRSQIVSVSKWVNLRVSIDLNPDVIDRHYYDDVA
jgi:hypothetical protein